MSDFNKEFLNALLNREKFDEFMRGQLQTVLNSLLESELTAFPGYNPYDRSGWNTSNSRNGSYVRKLKTQFGQIEVTVPRDQKGEFHQRTLPAYGEHTDTLETTIIQLYSHGVTTREIAELIKKMYGCYYSAGTISNITKQITSQVESYHQRKLNDKFFCIYLDATYIPLRRETYDREAVYVAVGIKPDGHKEIIDYRIAPVENLTVWEEMIADFKERVFIVLPGKLSILEAFIEQPVALAIPIKSLEAAPPTSEFYACLSKLCFPHFSNQQIFSRILAFSLIKQKATSLFRFCKHWWLKEDVNEKNSSNTNSHLLTL